MRHSFFLHLALGLLSWSSQLVGASTEPQKFERRAPSHLPIQETDARALPSPATPQKRRD